MDARHEAAVREFAKAVRAGQKLWGLVSEQGWAVCESVAAAGTDVMPFWASEADAARHAADEWAGYHAEAVDLNEFLEHWTLGLAGDGMLVGVAWDDALEGAELEAEVLEEMLLGER